jgi:hypothetical protein
MEINTVNKIQGPVTHCLVQSMMLAVYSFPPNNVLASNCPAFHSISLYIHWYGHKSSVSPQLSFIYFSEADH